MPLRAILSRWASALALIAVAGAEPAAAAESSSLEYAVKANFLYKFAPFVEWPPTAFASPADPLTVCVVGHDPFGAVLDQAVAGQRFGERMVRVRRLDGVGRDSGCQIVYLAGDALQPRAQALAALKGIPVLTVTDGAEDPAAHGIIHFIIQNNRVRFDIDDAEAAQNDLTVSSKLLSLARAVRPRP